jgi:hypothetical protein
VHAVVLAFELDDLLATGEGARDAHRMHRGLGAGYRHARLVHPAGQLLDELHRADLVLARQGEADATPHPLVDVVVHAVVAVPEDDRPIPHAQIDELVAIDVPDPATLAPIDIHRVVAPRPEVRAGAAGHRLEGSPVEGSLTVTAERGDGVGGGFGGHGDLGMGFGRSGVRDRGCVQWDACRRIVP